MPLESATYISDLDPTNPVGSSDLVSSLDDHMRLVKATLKNTFPNIDGAVNATEDQINLLTATSPNNRVLRISSGVVEWGQLTAGMFPSQVVPDSALSSNVPLKSASNTFQVAGPNQQSIVAETGTSRFAALRMSVDSGGTFSYVGVDKDQSLLAGAADGDLILRTNSKAIAFSTNNGLSAQFKIASDGTITLNGVNVSDYARQSQGNTFKANQKISVADEVYLRIDDTTAGTGLRQFGIVARDGSLFLASIADNDAYGQTAIQITKNSSQNITNIGITGAAIFLNGAATFNGVVTAPTIATSTNTTLVAGQVHVVTGNAALPNMAAGQWVGVINNSASPITVTKNASDTMYWTASGSSVTSVTVAARGKAAFICADGANVYASGNITGAS